MSTSTELSLKLNAAGPSNPDIDNLFGDFDENPSEVSQEEVKCQNLSDILDFSDGETDNNKSSENVVPKKSSSENVVPKKSSEIVAPKKSVSLKQDSLIRELKDTNDQLETKIKKLENNLHDTTIEKDRLKSQVDTAQEKLSDLKKQLVSSDSEKVNLERTLTQKKKEISDFKTKSQTEHKNEVQNLNQHINDLKSKYEKNTSEIKKLKEDVKEAATNVVNHDFHTSCDDSCSCIFEPQVFANAFASHSWSDCTSLLGKLICYAVKHHFKGNKFKSYETVIGDGKFRHKKNYDIGSYESYHDVVALEFFNKEYLQKLGNLPFFSSYVNACVGSFVKKQPQYYKGCKNYDGNKSKTIFMCAVGGGAPLYLVKTLIYLRVKCGEYDDIGFTAARWGVERLVSGHRLVCSLMGIKNDEPELIREKEDNVSNNVVSRYKFKYAASDVDFSLLRSIFSEISQNSGTGKSVGKSTGFALSPADGTLFSPIDAIYRLDMSIASPLLLDMQLPLDKNKYVSIHGSNSDSTGIAHIDHSLQPLVPVDEYIFSYGQSFVKPTVIVQSNDDALDSIKKSLSKDQFNNMLNSCITQQYYNDVNSNFISQVLNERFSANADLTNVYQHYIAALVPHHCNDLLDAYQRMSVHHIQLLHNLLSEHTSRISTLNEWKQLFYPECGICFEKDGSVTLPCCKNPICSKDGKCYQDALRKGSCFFCTTPLSG